MGKKEKAAKAAELTKAERQALKAREAELAAELERREKKAEKKRAKKVKAKLEAEKADLAARAAERKAKSPSKKSAKAETSDAARKVLADENASDGAKVAAETAAEAAREASDEETDAQIRARVQAKRAARAGDNRPSPVITTVEGLDAIVDPTPEKVEAAKAAVAAAREAITSLAETVEVETERGREFVVGESPLEDTRVEEFAKPSDAPLADFEQNGNGQYKVKRLSDGKVVGYTRTTTYIANLEDRSNLEKWKLRMLLEGIAINDHPDEDGRIDEPVVATMRDLIHRRDVAISKARKADRKGKLETGELAGLVEGAWREFKRAVNDLAEKLLDVGGVHEKATKGTDLHALMELYDREGIDAVGDLLVAGKITPADLADVEAYADACRRAGIRIIPELIERPIVVEDLKVAGRLDRGALVKFPGSQRAVRVVADIKTGRIDYSPGKLAQQLEMYAKGEGYDLDTHEREDLKLSRTKAIVIHVPAGSGKAHIYPVDLTLGRRGNALSGEVRAWRNEQKRAVDFDTDLAAGTASE